MFWIGSKSSGGPLFSSFGNLGVVGDLLGGSVVTDGHGNFNCFRGPDVMKKKFPSKPDTANESLFGFRGIKGSVCNSRYSAFVVVILSMLNQIPPYFLKSLRHPPPEKSGSGSGSRSGMSGSGSGSGSGSDSSSRVRSSGGGGCRSSGSSCGNVMCRGDSDGTVRPPSYKCCLSAAILTH